jgi:hypothetical protein
MLKVLEAKEGKLLKYDQAFTPEDVETFQSLADMIAVSLDNIHLLNETRSLFSQLESITSYQTQEVWKKYTSHRSPAYQYTPAGGYFGRHYLLPLPDRQFLQTLIGFLQQDRFFLQLARPLLHHAFEELIPSRMERVSTCQNSISRRTPPARAVERNHQVAQNGGRMVNATAAGRVLQTAPLVPGVTEKV